MKLRPRKLEIYLIRNQKPSTSLNGFKQRSNMIKCEHWKIIPTIVSRMF